jgi:hypothetical protein
MSHFQRPSGEPADSDDWNQRTDRASIEFVLSFDASTKDALF